MVIGSSEGYASIKRSNIANSSMLSIPRVPYAFFQGIVDLGWDDVIEGIERGVFSSQVAVDMATAQLANPETKSGPESLLVDLAISEDDADRMEITRRLAAHGGQTSPGDVLFVVLAWIFKNKDWFADPLATLEVVYGEFDYPREMRPFIGWESAGLPADGQEQWRTVAMDYWKTMIEERGFQTA